VKVCALCMKVEARSPEVKVAVSVETYSIVTGLQPSTPALCAVRLQLRPNGRRLAVGFFLIIVGEIAGRLRVRKDRERMFGGHDVTKGKTSLKQFSVNLGVQREQKAMLSGR